MTNYTVMRWSSADADAARIAGRTTRRLRETGWWLAIDEPGWCVALDRATPAARLRIGAEGRTIVIGSLFDRAATELGRDPGTILPAGPTGFHELARTLTQRGWGAYVAIGIDGADPATMSIFRDPVGALECVTWTVGGLRIVSSAPEAVIAAARPAGLGIDWEKVARLLAFPGMVGEDLPFVGLEAVPAGVVQDCRANRSAETRIWHPASHCSLHPAAMEEPERRLAWLVDSCVAAWCLEIRNGVAELSGGLDSAIVAAAASRTLPRSVHRWFHYSSDDLAGDERAFAQAVATHLGVALTTSVCVARRLDMSDIETMPVTARPGLGSTSLFHDRDLAARLETMNADAVLTGHGGDAVFFQPASPLVAADLWSDRRSMTDRLSALRNVAHWSRVSIWKALHVALRDRWHRTRLSLPPVTHAFLGKLADGAEQRSPWVVGTEHLPPAKQLQVWMIANCRSAFGASWCSQGRRMIHPLMSQPLIEHVLAIPAIDLTHGRRERALARMAFSRRLPAMLIDRRGKGDLTLYFGRMLAGSTVFLREYLLDGLLATHDVIDRAALEAILTPDTLMAEDHYSELMTTIIMERWARGWSERLEWADDQGEDASVLHDFPAGSK